MDQPAATSAPNIAQISASSLNLTFDSRGETLIGLGFANGLLRTVTLGLYSFWAKTEVRRKLWSFVRLNGEPLEYTGTGKELFLGFMIMFGVVVLPALVTGVAVSLAFSGNRTALLMYQTVAYLIFFLLIGNAMYRAQRYRLSRTRWRGIRGALVGSPGGYSWMYFWTLALPVSLVASLAFIASQATGPAVGGVILVIGLIAALWVLPWRANALQRRLTGEMRFGNAPLTYSGSAGPLYARYFYAWLGSGLTIAAAVAATFGWALDAQTIETWRTLRTPPAMAEIGAVVAIWLAALSLIAVITASYRASQFRHFASSTFLGAAQFSSGVKGPGLAWIVVSNWALKAAGLVIGLTFGATLIYALGAAPAPAEFETVRPEATMLQVALALVPIVVFSTAATTFAQFRAARYFLVTLKLGGDIDFAAIQQSAGSGPNRGEGLAQVFDLDAF